MRYLLLILSLTLYAAEAPKLPAEAQTAIDKADKAILTVQSKADAEIAKLRQGLITTLTKAQEAVTKKGDLDGATGIKARIEAERKLLPDLLGDAVVPKDITKDAVGSWKMSGGYTITLTATKVASWKDATHSLSGSWSFNKQDSSVVVQWQNGIRYRITSVDGDSMKAVEVAANDSDLGSMSGVREK